MIQSLIAYAKEDLTLNAYYVKAITQPITNV